MNIIPIGIDLGYTSSCSALMKGKEGGCRDVLLIPTETSKYKVPSYVYYKNVNGSVVADLTEINQKKHIKSTIYDSKRMIGKRFSELDPNDIKKWDFNVVNRNGEAVIRITNNNRYIYIHPEDVSSEILKRIKIYADQCCGNIESLKTLAVITVPAYFNHRQREKTIEAAEKANLKVMRLITEPTAAAIAYCYENREINDFSNTRLLIYDMGYNRFDLSVVDIETVNLPENNYRYERDVVITITVRAIGGDGHFGCEDFDNAIVKKYADNYKNKTGVDLYVNSKECIKKMERLKKAVKDAKIPLLDLSEATFDCEFLEDADISTTVTRAYFEEICSPLFKETISNIDNMLNKNRINKNTIKGVILAGNITKVSKLTELLKIYFEEIKIYNSIKDEPVARGAAIVANNKFFRNIIERNLADTSDEKLMEMNEKNIKEKEELKNQVNELKMINERIKLEKEKIKEENNQIKKEKEELKEQINKIKKEKEIVTKELKKQINEIKKKEEEAKSFLKELGYSKIPSTLNHSSKVLREIDKNTIIFESSEDYEKESEELKRELRKMTEELEKERVKKLEEIEKKRVENENLKKEKEKMEEEKSQVKKENEIIKEENNQVKKENEELKEQINRDKEENENLKREKEEMLEEVEMLKLRNTMIVEENERMKKEIKRKEIQINAMIKEEEINSKKERSCCGCFNHKGKHNKKQKTKRCIGCYIM